MISVVIPVFNRRTLLMQAAASVLGQQYTDIELIIADDGSTDGLEDDIQVLLADPRVRYHRNEHLGMPGAVRNIGAEFAEGEWLAFLDSDDLWLPAKLSEQLKYAESHPEVSCIHGREIWLRGETVVSQKSQKHKREGDIFYDSLKKCIIGPSTVLMKTSLFRQLRGFREDLEIAEDYEFWLRLTSGEQVGYVDIPLVIKRAGYGGEQLSEKYGQIEVFRIRGLLDLVESSWFSRDRERQDCAEKELARKCMIYSCGAGRRKNMKEAAEYAEIAQKYS